MSTSDLVSVIVPCYNYGHLLAETLESVRSQSHENWECIVVDDGSTDNSREVVASFAAVDPRFRYLHQQNAGVAAARNAGIAAASGEFFQFLDADDLLESQKLARQQAFLAARPGVDVVYGDAWYFTHGEPLAERRKEKFDTVTVCGAGLEIMRHLVRDNVFVMCSPLVRASVLERIGGFDAALSHLEDWEFWLRCALGGVSFCHFAAPDSAALIRRRPGSLSTDDARMLRANLQLRRELAERLTDADCRSTNRARLITTRIHLACATLENGDRLAGMRELFSACLAGGRVKSCLYGLRIACRPRKDGP